MRSMFKTIPYHISQALQQLLSLYKRLYKWILCPCIPSLTVQQPIRNSPALFRFFVKGLLTFTSFHFLLLNCSAVSSPLSMPTPILHLPPILISHTCSPNTSSFSSFSYTSSSFLPVIREYSDTEMAHDHQLHNSIKMEKELNIMRVAHIKF